MTPDSSDQANNAQPDKSESSPPGSSSSSDTIHAPIQEGGGNNYTQTTVNLQALAKDIPGVLDAMLPHLGRGKNFEGWSTEFPERAPRSTELPGAWNRLEALRASGIMAVECADASYLHEAAAWIASHGGYDSKLLVAPANPAFFESTQRPNLAGYIGWLCRERKDKALNEKTLMVVQIASPSLRRALVDAQITLASYKGALPAAQLHLLFLLFPEPGSSAALLGLHACADVWQLPVLPLVLQQAFDASPVVDGTHELREALRTRIETQRRNKRWSQDETAFWHELLAALGEERTLENLQFEADRRDTESPTALARPTTIAMPLARSGNIVERALLFATAFCGRCSIYEQTLMLQTILGERQMPASGSTSLSRTAPLRPRRQMVSSTTSQPDEPSAISEEKAIDYWHREDTAIRERCGVRTETGENGARFADFAHPAAADAARATLSDSYVVECFEAVSRGLIFHLDPSIEPLIAKLVRVAAEMCERYPDRFGDTWLRQVLGSIGERCALEFAAGLSPQTSLGDWFRELHRMLEKHGRMHNRLQHRLANLCEAMMERASSRLVVIKFIDSLINEKACAVAVRLIKRLWEVEPETSFRWLRRCINEAPTDERELTEQALFTICCSGPRQLDILLRQVVAWLPEMARAPEQFSPAEIFATLFPLRLMEALTEADPDPTCLFGLEDHEARWQRLVRWLCHSKLDEWLAIQTSDAVGLGADFANRCRAISLAGWLLRANATVGNSTSAPGSSALKIIDGLRSCCSAPLQRVAREVIGHLLGEAERRWVKAADACYRSPMETRLKLLSNEARGQRDILQLAWKRLGEPLPK